MNEGNNNSPHLEEYMNKKTFPLDFSKFISKEEDILKAKLEGIRATIEHAQEKGRSIEYAVMQLLRSFLPNEYGLCTGFIAYHENNNSTALSSQLDIIIYDALRTGPLIRLGSCEVVPIEGVFAYVEVKTSLNHKEITRCIKQSNSLRKLMKRFYWIPKSVNKVELKLDEDSLPIRTFIFALEANQALAKSESIRKFIEKKLTQRKMRDAFITGMYVNNSGFYRSLYKYERVTNELVKCETDKPLVSFKIALFEALSRYPRKPKDWTPAIDRYFGTDTNKSGDSKPGATATSFISDNGSVQNGTVKTFQKDIEPA